MSINDLPDGCLLNIFGHLYELDDLVNCFKVCINWSHLVVERTRKVKYLLEEPYEVHVTDHVYYRFEDQVDGSCLLTLFPNLEIVEFTGVFFSKMQRKHIFRSVRNMIYLKGLILHNEYPFVDNDEKIVNYCDQLEMVAVSRIGPHTRDNGAKIKQLHLGSCALEFFRKEAKYFPNVERIHIFNAEDSPDDFYLGPEMDKVKIVELDLSYSVGSMVNFSFQFMDSCPNLQSAHVVANCKRLYADKAVTNLCLRDLVLEGNRTYELFWVDFTRMLAKYPNLKHLAIRNYSPLNNDHVAEIVRILPNLDLLDVRGCPEVTLDAAIDAKKYYERYERSIKLYFEGNAHEIFSDWPQWSTKREKFSLGFDFMKHCFLKSHGSLSDFLIPIDGDN